MFSSSRTRPEPTDRVTRVSLAVAIAIALSLPSWALTRPGLPPRGVSNPNPPASPIVGLVTHDLATGGETPASLVQALVGTGAVVSNIQYSGAPIAAGTFTGGTGIIGIESGVILGTGNIASIVGPTNQSPQTTTDNGLPGDPDLNAIINEVTRDASVLEFDLECQFGGLFSLDYVFSSEEYDCPPIDDVFACYLNGQNIARIPGTNSPITVASVNCGCPYNPPSGPNCSFHRTNDCESLGLGFPCTNIATEMDGLTVVLTATGVLSPGLNHVKLAIADFVDWEYDSNVFIRGTSVHCSSPAPVFGDPSPCSQVLFAYLGVPLSFQVQAAAANGLPGESVTLTVAGSTPPLAGGTFLPPLPAGPAQPVSTRFDWTPSGSDWGLHHLIFTATDQLQAFARCDVYIDVSSNPPPQPIFLGPSPCGQTLIFPTGSPSGFQVAARAENSMIGQSVTLSVAGDATPLAGGTFVPPLPAGPGQPVSTQFRWSPSLADVGTYHLQFTATDQLQTSNTCDVTIEVTASPGINLCQPGTGTVIPCPCSNPSADSSRGCDNSQRTGGALLYSTGSASIGNDTVLFTTIGQRSTTLSIVAQGNAFLVTGQVYGQGVRCFGGLLKRMYEKIASSGSITAPQAGDPPVSVRSAARGDTITPGTSRYYAVYYRDSTILGGCPPSARFNVTQTQEILWSP